MRAAYSTGPGAIALREQSAPEPGAGEVLVRVRNCGICGSDLHWFSGDMPAPGVCPGHEIAGEVIGLGAGAGTVRIGDRVAVEPLAVCRECAYCRTGQYQLCPRLKVIGIMRAGGFADQLAVPAYAVYSLPQDMDFELGSLAEPMAVCVHGVRLAGVTLGDRVLVLGAGTIGLLSVLAARAAGAVEVAITARHPHQADLARRLGARVFPTTAAGEADRVAWSSDCPVDAVIETVGGTADTLADAVMAVRSGGTVAVLGVFTGATMCPALALVVKEVRLVGSMTYGRAGSRADFDIALAVLAANAAAARELITHRFELPSIGAAFATAADKRGGAVKVTVTP